MHQKSTHFMQHGLYDINDVRDNCGFGLIAHMDGEASHHLVQTAITALSRMTHRGAIAADGKTGDGCGLMLQTPKVFFTKAANELGFVLNETAFAVGMVFLNPNEKRAKTQETRLTTAIEQQDCEIIGWRSVPTNESACGEHALASKPLIKQVFIQPKQAPITQEQFELKLFLARRHAEISIKDDPFFYISSLSSQVIVYKGLVMPEQLPVFYPDLKDKDMASGICVFHQRFSTNTLPQWRLAQPFRFLAHNGEINTIQGNRNWSVARAKKFACQAFPNIDAIRPLVDATASDSASLDNMLEVLNRGGMPLFSALRLLIPPAWQNVQSMDSQLRAFFEYHSLHMEPWDGPAGIVLTDGRFAVCALDRNGLRPARYVITQDRYITLASEIGVYDYAPNEVIEKGRLGPGQIFAVDTQNGKILNTQTIDYQLKTAQPYRQWLRQHSIKIYSKLIGSSNTVPTIPPEHYLHFFKQFQVSTEERIEILKPLGETGQEPIGSMGDDTPMAVLSRRVRPLYDYFRQQFAQVTNPPIDHLREAIVMSLEVCFGREPGIFEEEPKNAKRIIVDSPVLSLAKFTQILEFADPDFASTTLKLYYPESSSLEKAIKRLCHEAEKAVLSGTTILVLSDRALEPGRLPIHAALATGAVHHHLINKGLRSDANIIVETATARNGHHFAVLIGFGATAIYPYLAYECFRDLGRTGELVIDPVDAIKHYRHGIEKSLLKIMSKMGISTIGSYRGAQLFECVGLADEVVRLCFTGAKSRIAGATFQDLHQDQAFLAAHCWNPHAKLDHGGLLSYMHESEYHAFNPDVVTSLIRAAQSGEHTHYQRYAEWVNNREVATLRDLLSLQLKQAPIPLDHVEPASALYPRFDTAGMSLGALSPEAHEALASAMHRLGGRSNSGEGGEDKKRFNTERNSKIKQVASGRFGVTPHYLVNCEVLQIKIAQGAKPGEGGQLPGHKVTPLIAKLRYSVPGVTLISPPPHHDIYSIEDLAQLIFDLKQVNPRALISVKLVSEPGVGTIAVGVAKAYADMITISGYDGGTAASPLSSIKYAGSPWELGLSEAHQALVANGLRHKVRLQVDGGLKTGLDVIKAAILGAESFGFGTAPMIALGCKYLRICHLNNCATGVATQNSHLRKFHFTGLPEMVMHFFQFVAEETREWLARCGVSQLTQLIGRTDLLKQIAGTTEKQKHLDLSPLLAKTHAHALYCTQDSNPSFDKGVLAEQIIKDTQIAVSNRTGGIFHYEIKNYHRSIGARLSGEIAKKYGNRGFINTPITLQFKGTAGQSFGVWNVGGLNLILEGDANDYVGKGMTGGNITLFPPKDSRFDPRYTPIIGNTCLYGATGGTFYASGLAGERFAVRNSGATAIVEGMGDHGCEYMTGGVVVSLGAVGQNFGAGMTGGIAYVLDLDNQFVDLFNSELIEIHRINIVDTGAHRMYLRQLIEDYTDATGSQWGLELLDNYEDYLRHFWLVKPKASTFDSLLNDLRLKSA